MSDVTLNSRNRRHAALQLLLERVITRIGRAMLPGDLSGTIRIAMPSGNVVEVAGNRPGHDAHLTIKSWKVLLRALQAGGNGFAEGYIRDEVSSSYLVRLVRFFAANRKQLMTTGGKLFSSRGIDRLRHLNRANTKAGSRRNIAAHYDLSNAFFKLWLDDTMTYSSAVFETSDMPLDAAQQNKYGRIIAALDLPPQADILEIGCGWGGFAAHVIPGSQHNYTGITLSREQLRFAMARPEFSSADIKADFHYQDYRDVTGQFDAIASIEMIEAVGETNWPAYFQTLHDRLKPGGTAVIQSITIDPQVFERYRRKADFIQSYIFPGGMLPTPAVIEACAKQAGLTPVPMECFGQDYARTLKLWRERFEDRWPEISDLGFDDRFRRMWRYYLAYCEGGFEEQLIDVQIFKFTRPA